VPLIETSDYKPPWYWQNRHLQTILPNRVRYVGSVELSLETASIEGHEVDLFWSRVESDCVVVVAHGLGGHVHRPYVLGMVRAFNRAGVDAVAWHVWGDGAGDKAPHLSHGGSTDGVRRIVNLVASKYRKVFLVGFSLGGNVVLKYLGEEGRDSDVVGAVVLSVPCDLEASAVELSTPGNRLYLNGFLKTLKGMVRRKAAEMPDTVSVEGLEKIDSLVTFDDRYTAPLNGFKNAHEYYLKCSSLAYLGGIGIPTLMVNARNDPFLTESCYPVEMCGSHESLHLEVPDSGGHVGFPLGWGRYWSETRSVTFLSAI
jgi:predicted alpha/beta-fold hydrolase